MDGAGDVLDWLYGHEGEARVAFTSGASRVDAVLPAEVMRSVRDVLFKLPAETIVYPGHGPASKIGDEAANNPFCGEFRP